MLKVSHKNQKDLRMLKHSFIFFHKYFLALIALFILAACNGGGGSGNTEDGDDSLPPVTTTGRPFVTTWKTDNIGATADNQIRIGTSGDGYNYSVDWGDGESDTNVSGDITHTYSQPGTYTVSIDGAFPRIIFGLEGHDNQKILSVEQWGNIAWESMQIAFLGCINLVINASDAPDLSRVMSMRRMFTGAESLNQDIGDWDVSSVEDMNELFSGATSFNQNINSWDVSSVTLMSRLFQNASSFNQDLSDWDVSSVTDMSLMFAAAEVFNRDISLWDVSHVTDMSFMFAAASAFDQAVNSWDVSSVTNMSGMFSGAESFSRMVSTWQVASVTSMASMFSGAQMFNDNLSSWDVTNVTDMSRMFSDAIMFDQDLSGWDVRLVSDMTDMFEGVSLSTDNYDALLNGWNALGDVQQTVSFSGGDSTFSPASADARENLIQFRNWNITDGGVVQ